MTILRSIIAVLLAILASSVTAAGRLETHNLTSQYFENNRLGISPTRKVQVYLPSGYDSTNTRYPVLYFLHTFFENEHTFFAEQQGQQVFDAAQVRGTLDAVILVTADFSTPTGGSLYTNSPVTGQWRSFMTDELVPFIDANFRTLSDRRSRGIFGYQAGGYGAIRIASRHPEIFGSVYALHPVATGFGHTLMQSRPDWDKLANVSSISDWKGDPLSEIFTAIYQANLPNPDRPPLFFDPPAYRQDGQLILDARLTDKLQERFFLERQVGVFAENMRSLIGFKFDWGRHDGNQDHVYSNQFYSRKLNEYGVTHEAEEYNGGWGDKTFGEGGRIETDVIPFFRQHLSFESQP